MTDPSAVSPEPPGGFKFRQILPTLAFDVAIPIALYYLLTSWGVATLWALIAGGISPAINNLRSWFVSRRLEPLGVIVIAFLAIGSAASLISGSVFFALIKESLMTATFGLLCLGSLLGERPLMFYINRQFVAGEDSARLAWWNGLWQYPPFRAAQRFVTLVWGIAYLLEALIRVGLALVLSPGQVVAISPVMAFAAMFALIAWTRRYLLMLRERRRRAEAAEA